MKKSLSILLALILIIVVFAGCGKTDPDTDSNVTPNSSENVESPDSDAQRVLFACSNLSDTFFLSIDEMMRANFEGGGYIYESVSAEMDPIKQIEQIENANAQGYDLVVIIPVTGEAVTDACQRAMDEGTLIFSFIFDTIARNSYRTTDPVVIANTAVDMTVEWADKKFPNATEGSINCVIIGNDQDPTGKAMHDACTAKVAEHPQFNVLENNNCEGTTLEGQAMAENILTSHPETKINIWFVTDTSIGIGVNSAIMAENSGVDYKDEVCVMGTGLSDEVAGLMKLSLTDESVIRLSAAPGGDPQKNLRGLYEQAVLMLSGEPYEALCPVNVDEAWPENLSDFGY